MFLPDQITCLVLICKLLLRYVSYWPQQLLLFQRVIFNCCFKNRKQQQVPESSSCMERAASNHSPPLIWSSNAVKQKKQCLSLCKNNSPAASQSSSSPPISTLIDLCCVINLRTAELGHGDSDPEVCSCGVKAGTTSKAESYQEGQRPCWKAQRPRDDCAQLIKVTGLADNKKEVVERWKEERRQMREKHKMFPNHLQLFYSAFVCFKINLSSLWSRSRIRAASLNIRGWSDFLLKYRWSQNKQTFCFIPNRCWKMLETHKVSFGKKKKKKGGGALGVCETV